MIAKKIRRVRRGSSFGVNWELTGAGNRAANEPTLRNMGFGLRVARTIP